MQEPIITLLTDFGERDPYVGAMKGVILSICPQAKIIDLSHDIEKHNIYEGALFLYSIIKYFPKHTIHLVVIDPGVGSKRKSLILQTDSYFLVGPDNGVLSLAPINAKIQKVFEITNPTYFLQPISDTFHGRDIFAPVAAHLANNRAPEKFGPLIEDWIRIEIPKPRVETSEIQGEIIHIDKFGNLITNIPKDIVQNRDGLQPKYIQIKIRDRELEIPLCSSYTQVGIGEFLAIFGSTNFLEISKNQENAADALNVKVKEKVSVKGLLP
jgi:S-adenosylmethionine hydrolase